MFQASSKQLPFELHPCFAHLEPNNGISVNRIVFFKELCMEVCVFSHVTFCSGQPASQPEARNWCSRRVRISLDVPSVAGDGINKLREALHPLISIRSSPSSPPHSPPLFFLAFAVLPSSHASPVNAPLSPPSILFPTTHPAFLIPSWPRGDSIGGYGGQVHWG